MVILIMLITICLTSCTKQNSSKEVDSLIHSSQQTLNSNEIMSPKSKYTLEDFSVYDTKLRIKYDLGDSKEYIENKIGVPSNKELLWWGSYNGINICYREDSAAGFKIDKSKEKERYVLSYGKIGAGSALNDVIRTFGYPTKDESTWYTYLFLKDGARYFLAKEKDISKDTDKNIMFFLRFYYEGEKVTSITTGDFDFTYNSR
jgi:hypothetical protein